MDERTRTQMYNGDIRPVVAVLIGQSTGFPHGLDTILKHLNDEAGTILFPKQTLPLSVIVAVHHVDYIDPTIGWIDKFCPRLKPVLLEYGMKVGRNGIYFCHGEQHTGIDRYASYAEVGPKRGRFGPNIDYLFISAIEYFKRQKTLVIPIILSGIDIDGAFGFVYAMNYENSLGLIHDPKLIDGYHNSMPLQTLARLFLLEQGTPWEKLPSGILPTEHVERSYNRLNAIARGKVRVTSPEEMGPIIIKKMRQELKRRGEQI